MRCSNEAIAHRFRGPRHFRTAPVVAPLALYLVVAALSGCTTFLGPVVEVETPEDLYALVSTPAGLSPDEIRMALPAEWVPGFDS